jgi:hypothetical protein
VIITSITQTPVQHNHDPSDDDSSYDPDEDLSLPRLGAFDANDYGEMKKIDWKTSNETSNHNIKTPDKQPMILHEEISKYRSTFLTLFFWPSKKKTCFVYYQFSPNIELSFLVESASPPAKKAKEMIPFLLLKKLQKCLTGATLYMKRKIEVILTTSLRHPFKLFLLSCLLKKC